MNNLLRDILTWISKTQIPHIEVDSYSYPDLVVIKVKEYNYPRGVINIVLNTLRRLKNLLVKDLLREIARNGKALYWRIFQVGQRFGAISSGETKISRRSRTRSSVMKPSGKCW